MGKRTRRDFGYLKGLICPRCGLLPERTHTRFGIRNSCCGMWSWGDKPLVDAETHEARQKAHEAFDPLWKTGRMTRNEAYSALQWATGLSEKNCHMARMDAERAKRVPAAVEKIIAVLDGE